MCRFVTLEAGPCGSSFSLPVFTTIRERRLPLSKSNSNLTSFQKASCGNAELFDDLPPPKALVCRAADSPGTLLSEVFDVYHSTFWHLITFRMDRRLMARVDADDILQDGFLATKQRINHWVNDPKYSLFAWVRMTILQTMIDIHRRHLDADMRCAGREISLGGARMPNTTAISLAGGLASNRTSPSGVAMRQESADQLHQAIEMMSDTDQEMIALRHFEGLTNKQAAEVLGLNITAASNRYVRALDRLQEVLKQFGS